MIQVIMHLVYHISILAVKLARAEDTIAALQKQLQAMAKDSEPKPSVSDMVDTFYKDKEPLVYCVTKPDWKCIYNLKESAEGFHLCKSNADCSHKAIARHDDKWECASCTHIEHCDPSIALRFHTSNTAACTLYTEKKEESQ
jgi:hypothetical protein